MSHLKDGALRRMVDEPASTSAADSAHLAACASCRERADRIRDDGAGVAAFLAVPRADLEPAAALAAFRRAAASQPGRAAGRWDGLSRLRHRRAFRPVLAAVLALGLLGGLVATGVADNFVQQFEPKTFVAVNVNPDSLGSLPDLSQFGTYKVTQEPSFNQAGSAAEALSASGLASLLQPSAPLPASVKGGPEWASFSQLQGSFTFSAARTRQYAASKGKALPAMPTGIDGTTVSLTAGPGVLAVYGAPPVGSTPGEPSTGVARRSDLQIPSLAIVQMTTPKVVSDGASVQVLENYLASLPGVPPELAAQIQAIGDPATTLPVPVPTGQGSHPVDVNGSKGLFVGDSTGLGAGVIWQRDGILYAVVGTLNESDVVAVARGLR